MMSKITLLMLVLILFSCKNNEVGKSEKLMGKTPKKSIFKDTIIRISEIKLSEKSNDILTNEVATKTLNTYFKRKGFLIQTEIDEDLNLVRLPQNKGKNVIGFSELFLFNNQLGIVTYWNAEPGAIGHCVQPHLALISNSASGLEISNEEFLPPNFVIDSLKTVNTKNIIYATDYDCYNHKFLKSYKIELEK